MAGKYVRIDTSELNAFVKKLNGAGQGQFKKELRVFLEGLADDFLSLVQDEIIQRQVVDTRLLLHSFHKGDNNSVYQWSDGGMTIEVGTNLEYASYVNDGHWTNPKGVKTRWVPGYWEGETFTYDPDAKTGMLLKQRWVEGTHYFDNALLLMEQVLPNILEEKMQEWLNSYFSGS